MITLDERIEHEIRIATERTRLAKDEMVRQLQDVQLNLITMYPQYCFDFHLAERSALLLGWTSAKNAIGEARIKGGYDDKECAIRAAAKLARRAAMNPLRTSDPFVNVVQSLQYSAFAEVASDLLEWALKQAT